MIPIPPWHQLCTLREDVRTGRLTLDEFAADLNGVRTDEAPQVGGGPPRPGQRPQPSQVQGACPAGYD